MSVDYTLYLVADTDCAGGRDLAALAAAAVDGGATIVQLRSKAVPDPEFLALARRVLAALSPSGVPLIVNDRVHAAAACGAAGVHLGQDDMPPAEARRILGQGRIVGVSVNTVDEALRAERDGADYVGLGPVHPTGSKATGLPVLGPDGVRMVSSAVSIPVVAIGGVTAANARPLLDAGAAGVAVISAILGRPDVREAARELRRALRG